MTAATSSWAARTAGLRSRSGQLREFLSRTGAAADASDRLRCLDGWRGMAILLVLAGHFSPFGSLLWKLGGAGVECFFVLSGRLMAELLIVRRQLLGDFFVRRASRLLPALWAFVVITTLVLTIGTLGGVTADFFLSALGAAGFFHNYLPAANATPYFNHSWSLAVEEHSYLLLAVIALLSCRSRRTAMVVAGFLAAAAMLNGARLAAIASPADQYVYWRTDVRAAAIFLSFAVWLWAEDYFRKERADAWRFAAPLCLPVGLYLLLNPAFPDFVHFGVASAFLAVAVCTLDRAHPWFCALFEWRGLVGFGLLSYSLYLWQQPFFLATRAGLPSVPALLLAFGAACWSFYRVEQPMRSWLNARWADRKRRSGAAALEAA